jgi:hypothetical protein
LMGFDEVFRMLEERRAAVGVELDRLGLEAERIAGLIASGNEELEELDVAWRVVGRLPGCRPSVGVPGGRGDPVRSDGPPVVSGQDGDAVSFDTPEEVFTPWLLAMLGEAGRAVRCQEVVRALGEDPDVARNVERIRHRLKKLARNGVVVEPQPGVFTLAGIDVPSDG